MHSEAPRSARSVGKDFSIFSALFPGASFRFGTLTSRPLGTAFPLENFLQLSRCLVVVHTPGHDNLQNVRMCAYVQSDDDSVLVYPVDVIVERRRMTSQHVLS